MYTEIRCEIIRGINDLETPLQQLMQEKLDAQSMISCITKPEDNIRFFNLCLYKVKGCKKIELDFPNTLIRAHSHQLTIKLDAIRQKLAEQFAITLGDPNSDSEYKANFLIPYHTLKPFFLHVFCHLNSKIQEKILDLLSLLLEIKEPTSIRVFNKEFSLLFNLVPRLVEKREELKAGLDCLIELDAIQTTTSFTQGLFSIKSAIYALIRETNSAVLYTTLLVQLNSEACNVFYHDKVLQNFIINFTSQFTRCDRSEQDFQSIICLIYLSLERKLSESAFVHVVPTTWIKTLNSLTEKLPVINSGHVKLTQFKNDYYCKIGVQFHDELYRFTCSNPDTVRQFTPRDVNPMLAHYFPIKNVNRASAKVKNAFFITLDKSLTEMNNIPLASDTTLERIRRISSDVLTIFSQTYVKTNESLKNKLIRVPEREKTPRWAAFADLKKNLEKMRTDIRYFQESMHKLCFSSEKNCIFPPCIADSDNDTDSFLSKSHEKQYQNLKEDIDQFAKSIQDFHLSNHPRLFVNELITRLQRIQDEYTWFGKPSKEKLSERLFRRGYISEVRVKFHALKTRSDKISFESEKSFFLSQNFFSLLRYGLICWPWSNKEHFAKDWAEQVVFLKIRDQMEEKKYALYLEQSTSNADFYEKIGFFSGVVELYKQIPEDRIEQGTSIDAFHTGLNQKIEENISKIDTLINKVKRYIPLTPQAAFQASSISKQPMRSEHPSFFPKQRENEPLPSRSPLQVY